MYRDFSDKSKENLLKLVSEVEEENWCGVTDWFGDRWLDFQTIIGKLNIKKYLDDIDEYHKKVIDKNNTTRSTIYAIFDEVKSIDCSYKSTFSSNKLLIEQLIGYIDALNQIINPSNGEFDFNTISSEMELLLSELDFGDRSVPPKHVLNDSKIISGNDYTRDFLEGRCQWFDALAFAWDSNWIKNTLSLFGVGENLNDEAVRKSIESLIKNTLENEHKGSDFYADYTSALTPDEFNNFKKVVDYTVKQGKTFSEFELAELLDMDVSEITECDYLNFLRAQTDLEFFESLSEGIDNTLGAYADAVEAIDVASQMIGRLVNDYTEDLQKLEDIRNAMLDGGYDQKVVNETINTITWNYRNQAASAILLGVEKLYEEGASAALGKALPLLSLLTASKDIGCMISGLGDKTENLEMIYTTQHYSYALVEKYEFYADKIRTGAYTQDDIDKCNSYFELARTAKIQEYEAMINLYKGALDAAGANDVQNGDYTQLKWQGGVVNHGVYSFVSEEDKQAARDAINMLEQEINRLKSL